MRELQDSRSKLALEADCIHGKRAVLKANTGKANTSRLKRIFEALCDLNSRHCNDA